VDASEDIGPLARYLGKRQLPSQFDWRNYDGHSYIGGIGNQGSCGSCYAFGACAAAEGTYNFANGLYDGNCSDFSESFIIWCLGNLPEYNPHFYGCGGSDYDYMELTALTAEGVCSEADFPYKTSPDCGDHWDDPRIAFDSWHRIPCGDIDAIKTAIMTYGVVDVAVLTTTAFEAYSGGIYEDTNTACDGEPCDYTTTDHIVALVGWDDNGDPVNEGYWILRNSWGSADWGESGYMRIKYRSAVVACEACYLVYGGGEDCSWLSEDPTSGNVEAGNEDNITVTIDTAGLAEGDYTAEIVIANNDPDEDSKTVPVTLHVSEAATSYDITLYEGWNLVSLPLIPDSTAITDIINTDNLASGNMDNVDLVYYFDTPSETWLWWNGSPASTLTSMEDGLGYWMLMSGADTLTVHGSQVGDPPPEYNVIVGWNMIGLTSTATMAPEVYLASAAGDYALLYGWDAVGETWLWWNGSPASTLTTMEPGDGYWILMDNPGTITPP
ncbi:MAG: C1 family peptidase, partial [Dehalococcoidia bacterium]|nr:C1 family peptidase [Dehalococcoidia bacterium]